MASIKAIEGRSIHHIQSGQVIVDLCSVVKEVVENSLDAGASSIDIRFKNQGLESIEVQDNGPGISPDDFETIALKHYTSKLSSYDDLTALNTFGFRGEALSSLCALSKFHVVTARDGEAPKGKRLDFETSGKLKEVSVAAAQKGTTVSVDDLFYNLPVRRRDLEKNIKREYGKVLGILYAYACVSTGVRFSVSNQMTKGKKVSVFSTRSSSSTRENIANVFGAKTVTNLISLDIDLELQQTSSQVLRDLHNQNNDTSRQVRLEGHVSRPVFGEGRQTPDRQMFFVNFRPCGLPQISKAFNEVYKSYNVTQSPFVFANFKMDTNAYDVNVSPDKRTILLHDQTTLLEKLKESLVKLFEAQEQTVPQSQLNPPRMPAFRPLNISREMALRRDTTETVQIESDYAHERSPHEDIRAIEEHSSDPVSSPTQREGPTGLIQKFVGRNARDRNVVNSSKRAIQPSEEEHDLAKRFRRPPSSKFPNANQATSHQQGPVSENGDKDQDRILQDFKARLASQRGKALEAVDDDKESQDEPVDTSYTAQISAEVGDGGDPGETSKRDGDSRVDPMNTTYNYTTTNNIARTNNGRASDRLPSSPPLDSTTTAKAAHLPRKLSSLKTLNAHDSAPDGHTQARGERNADETNDSENSDLEMQGIDNRIDPETNQLSSRDNSFVGPEEIESDGEYIDETERRRRDEARIEEMLRRAEEAEAKPTQEQQKRATNLLKNKNLKDTTVSILKYLDTTVEQIDHQLSSLNSALSSFVKGKGDVSAERTEEDQHMSKTRQNKVSSTEERLSLTITKSDFLCMRIVGQFNLGFILATRNTSSNSTNHPSKKKSDLFIIDQHASDEIYNFHVLSQNTSLAPQPLVRPHHLELTAIEEETILHHSSTLQKNGFTISFDSTGNSPVGKRCHLLTLPTSRETVFNTRDLEELIVLLNDTPSIADDEPSLTSDEDPIRPKRKTDQEIPRPSKVRKMLAMRACRSSIMIGKHLTQPGMEKVVRHMGTIERPWNCPHGRPTMRHLASLEEWEGWKEGDGLAGDGNSGPQEENKVEWGRYLVEAKEKGLLERGKRSEQEEESGEEDEEISAHGTKKATNPDDDIAEKSEEDLSQNEEDKDIENEEP